MAGGWNFQPSHPDLWRDPVAYSREYNAARALHFRGVVLDEEGNVVEQEEVEVVEKIVQKVVLRAPAERVEPMALGTSPKKVAKAASSLDWEVLAWQSITDVEPVLFVNDSVEGAEDEHSAGDVRYAGYVGRHYRIEARSKDAKLGFQAFWMGKGETGTTASFVRARVFDPLGVPVENFCDGRYGTLYAKDLGMTTEQRERDGAQREARINDGSSRLEHIYDFSAGTDFLLWMDDWLRVAGLEAIAPKPKATKEEKWAAEQERLLKGGVWNG